ncbi:MAG TPA: cytochrome c oxidase assembly factor Coa1 family protein [Thermoanaerobaculia bacterium]|jgi:hypothetical protein
MSEPYLGATRKKELGPLAWLGIGCGVMLFCVVGFVILMFVMVFGSLRASEPFKEATARARRDARVIAAIGSPVKVAMFFTGSIHTANRGGNADLNLGLTGPNGKARLIVVGTKSDGVWKYSTMRVEPEKGPPIDLLTSSEGSTSTAPPAS